MEPSIKELADSLIEDLSLLDTILRNDPEPLTPDKCALACAAATTKALLRLKYEVDYDDRQERVLDSNSHKTF